MQWARSLRALAAIGVAVSAIACDRTLVVPSQIASTIDRVGLRLEPGILADPLISREVAVHEALETFDDAFDGLITAADLVAVSGPGNPRLGWAPVEHPLVYAVQWSDGSTVGLVLVSARTGEILLVTSS